MSVWARLVSYDGFEWLILQQDGNVLTMNRMGERWSEYWPPVPVIERSPVTGLPTNTGARTRTRVFTATVDTHGEAMGWLDEVRGIVLLPYDADVSVVVTVD